MDGELTPEQEVRKENRDKVLRKIAEIIISGEFLVVTVGIQLPDGSSMTFVSGNPMVARGLSETLYDEAIEYIEDMKRPQR